MSEYGTEGAPRGVVTTLLPEAEAYVVGRGEANLSYGLFWGCKCTTDVLFECRARNHHDSQC